MPLMDEKDLKQQLKSGAFSGLYIIYGNEDYLKRHYVNQIADKAVKKDFADFNLHRFDGKSVTLDEVYQSVEAMPMMSERTCIVVKDMPLDSLTGNDADKFNRIISDVPETTVLIFWMDRVEVQPKKSAKWKKLIATFESLGAAVELNKRDLTSLRKLVCSGAEKRNCRISPDNASYLIACVGDDMTNLLSELEKLCAFVGEGEITAKIIDEAAVKSVEAVVYDLTKALLAGKSDKAYSTLNLLLRQKTEPVMIMGVLISAYVDMYRAKLFQKSGFRPEDAARVFDYKNRDFRLKNAVRDASGMSLEGLRNCLDLLSDTDEKLKSSGVEPRILLEQCMTRLFILRTSSGR